MWEDPIVKEVRKVRNTHAARYNYDLRAIYQALKEEEAEGGRKFVKLSPKCIEKQKEIPAKSEAWGYLTKPGRVATAHLNRPAWCEWWAMLTLRKSVYFVMGNVIRLANASKIK